MDELIAEINRLYFVNAMHRKRGFCLQDITKIQVSNQIIEESAELQSEVIANCKEGIIDESADVLVTFLQLLSLYDISLETILSRSFDKLNTVFTTNKDEVLTNTPGFTRRTRVSVPITKPASSEPI